MSTLSYPYLLNGVHQPDGRHLEYSRCRAGHSLAIESLEAHPGPKPGHTSVVLQFRGEYVHCGEPMRAADSVLHGVYAVVTTEPTSPEAGEEALELYLRTRVLRCICGFQMELPS